MHKTFSLALLFVFLAGCSGARQSGGHGAQSPKVYPPQKVESAKTTVSRSSALDGGARTSKFSALTVGMESDEVNLVLGRAPDIYHTYESGKRWIPFYFGTDAVRIQAYYKGEGCLIFSAGFRFQNHGVSWDQFYGHLAEIRRDLSGDCYQP